MSPTSAAGALPGLRVVIVALLHVALLVPAFSSLPIVIPLGILLDLAIAPRLAGLSERR